MTPCFSVAVPCRNVAPYVAERLQSVLDQPVQDGE